jgi:hypothetical protein
MGRNSTEMNAFNSALKQVLSVPADELRKREDEWKREKAQKKRKSRTSASGRVSSGKD